jgi:glycosyltransferase involved in cell wall biosynthesis
MKILINTPDISLLGGVANHYKGLIDFWTENVKYNFIGSRMSIPGILLIPFDLIKFFIKCLIFQPNIIVLNPSLGKRAFYRDALFLKISYFLKIKTIVFFHGWDKKFEKQLSSNPQIFQKQYGYASAFIVLASEFKELIHSWGIDKHIYITTTKVDDKLISDFSIEKKIYKKNILFLARIIEEKGVYVALEAFKKIVNLFPDTKLTIVGDGSDLANIQRLVKELNLSNVLITGALSGESLKEQFGKADIYIFPTFYGEGMPTSVLEAMAFGLPIITRPVGGLSDFFQNKKMGYLIDSLNPDDFAEKITSLFNDQKNIKEIGKYNYNYAKKHFYASNVALKMESIFNKGYKNRLK